MQKTEDPKAKLVVILLAGLFFISFGIVTIIIQNSIKTVLPDRCGFRKRAAPFCIKKSPITPTPHKEVFL